MMEKQLEDMDQVLYVQTYRKILHRNFPENRLSLP